MLTLHVLIPLLLFYIGVLLTFDGSRNDRQKQVEYDRKRASFHLITKEQSCSLDSRQLLVQSKGRRPFGCHFVLHEESIALRGTRITARDDVLTHYSIKQIDSLQKPRNCC